MAEPESASILAIGAINTDLVATVDRAPVGGETLNGSTFAIHGGGKAANQAVAIARAAGQVALVGAVGDDDFGRARIAELERDGVDTRWVDRTSQLPSGVALIIVERSGENRIVCVPGATDSITVDQALKALDAVRPAWVLATNEVEISVLRTLFAAARQAGARIALNVAPEPEQAASLLDLVDLVIANRGEAACLAGGTEDDGPGLLAARLLERGASRVVITLGAAGALVASVDGTDTIEPPTVDVVDTTGAGDTFCGSLVAERVRGRSWLDSVAYAVHASALSVTRAGAQSAIPTRQDVETRWPSLRH